MGAALDTLPDIVTVGPEMEGHFRTPYERIALNTAVVTDDQIYDRLGDGNWAGITNAWPDSDPFTYAEFTVVAAAPPEISLTATALSPAALEGENADDQQFGVANTGEGTLSYTITDDQTWLSVSPTSGDSTGETDMITVSYATAGLALGIYNATITVSDPAADNNPQTIAVTLAVTELPAIGLSQTMLAPEAQTGNDPLPETFKVANVGGRVLIYDVAVDEAWLSVDPASGTSIGEADTITVTYDTASLAEGVYNADIVVSDPAAVNNPQTIDVVLTIADSAALGVTEVRLSGDITSQITGLSFDPQGTYSKPGFPLVLPQTGVSGNFLSHDGGSFTFGSQETPNTYMHSDWTFELRNTCAAGGDPCNVTTSEGTPFALRNVNLTARTARLVLTDTGAQQWNDLAGETDLFQAEETFANVTFIPEPAAATLAAAVLAVLGMIGLAGRRRSATEGLGREPPRRRPEGRKVAKRAPGVRCRRIRIRGGEPMSRPSQTLGVVGAVLVTFALVTTAHAVVLVSGDIVIADRGATFGAGTNDGQILVLPSGGGTAMVIIGTGSGLDDPTDLAIEADGQIIVGDQGTNEVYRVDPVAETFSTLISGFDDIQSVALEADGDILVLDSQALFGAGARRRCRVCRRRAELRRQRCPPTSRRAASSSVRPEA